MWSLCRNFFFFGRGGGGKFHTTIPTPPLTKRENHDWHPPRAKKGKSGCKGRLYESGMKRTSATNVDITYLSCIVIRSCPKPDVLQVPVTVQYYQVSQHWQLPFGESRKGKVVVFGPQRGLTCRTWSQTQRQSDQRGICSRVGPEIKQL